MESSLITTKEVAEIFGKSKNAVNCWCKRGKLPSQKKAGGRLYFSKAFILEVKANYHGNISLAVKGVQAMNVNHVNHSAQIKLNFSEKFTPQFPTKTISLNDAQTLLDVDEDFLYNKIDSGELSNVDGNFYAEQILKLKFSNDEFAAKKVQGCLFTGDGDIDTTLDRIKAENAAQIERIDAIQINSAAWNYLLKLVRDYYNKGNVYLQVPLLDENLRGQLLKILPNDSNYISVDNEKLAWCTKDKQIIETLIQTADKVSTPIDENTTEPSTTENAVATPTLETLTVEIQSYFVKAQSYFVKMTENIIEIGKRLIKAKELVPHGQWQNWLNENFNLTYRSAKNFMDVAERFGGMVCKSENVFTFEPAKFKTENVFRFEPAKLISLLALPAGDEEKFIDAMTAKGTPIENLSVRKLKAEIKDWKDAAQIDSPADSLNDAAQVSNTDSADDSKAELVDDSTANSDVKDNAQVTIDVTPIDESARNALEQLFQLADELQRANYENLIAAVNQIAMFDTKAELVIDLMKNLLKEG